MLFAQSGYGRGNKVHLALDEGLIDGVILSPKDERRERIEECVANLHDGYNASILFDPQFYVTTLSSPRDGRLPEYEYYADNAPLGRTQFSPRQVSRYTSECINYQYQELPGLTHLVSPSVLFDDFRDSWSQISLNMADATIDSHSSLSDPQPLLLSIVTSELALQAATGMEEFLDALTTLDVKGFYLLIKRSSSSYQLAMDARAMGNLLYFVHVLADLNEYDVVVGYSDWLGFLFQAAGATATATGWHQSLRQFSMARFEPARRGGRPRKRYSSAPMLSSPLIVPEMQDIHRAGLLPNVLTDTEYDAILATNPAGGEARWTDEIGCLAHWAAIGNTIEEISAHTRPVARVAAALELIDEAQSLYDRLALRDVNFELQTGPNHLSSWRDSMSDFRHETGL